MDWVVQRSRGLKGEFSVPGDKSISHRAIILGSIAAGTSTLKGFLPAEDCLRTVSAFRQLGISIQVEKDTVQLEGKGLQGFSESHDVLDMGNSGTGMRLLAGFLAAQPFFSILTGDASLRSRPMRRIIEPLSRMGAEIRGREGGNHPPLAILGRRLKGIHYQLPVASAQVKSALLLAGLQADHPTTLVEPVQSRDHTERMLSVFGVDLKVQGSTVTLEPGRQLEPCDLRIPGDFSSAAFFIVAALITEGSELFIKGVGVNPTRIGAIEILRLMGGSILMENLREVGGEPVADIFVRSSPLKGIAIDPGMVPRAIDEFPVLAVAAACAEGETIVRGAAELRLKESDRLATMALELTRLGVSVEEQGDGWVIRGGQPLVGAVCSSHADHRVAMALAVAGLAASGETVITDVDCVETSFPGFETLLRKVQGNKAGKKKSRGVIAIDGPAGSGKSSAAREVARRIGYLYVDTGALYRAVGWKTLRDGVNFKSKAAVNKMIQGLKLQVVPSAEGLQVIVDDQDITDHLRTLEVSRAAASVAMMPAVRKRLLRIQRDMGKNGGVVVEGRDIGTVVFPEADMKIFLYASPSVRVQRRWKELTDKGFKTDLESTQQEIDIRDLKDSQRTIAPLKQAQDAIKIDSSHLSLNEVVEQILKEAREKLGTLIHE